MSKQRKPLVWLRGEVKTPPFSAEARIEAGVLLRHLQEGANISLPHSRPMPSIGRGCHELRIPDENHTWRIVYYIDTVAIVILDVFAKTTSQTPQTVIDVCKARLNATNQFNCRRINTMETDKLKRLQADGWEVGSAEDFLQLNDEEARLVALKLSLISAVKKSRIKRKLSQIDLAQRMKSSQSRIAKIEAGDPSVSLDLIVRALIASGATTRDIQVAFTTNERMVG